MSKRKYFEIEKSIYILIPYWNGLTPEFVLFTHARYLFSRHHTKTKSILIFRRLEFNTANHLYLAVTEFRGYW